MTMPNGGWFSPAFNTKTFAEVWESYDDFKADYDDCMPLMNSSDEMTENSIKTTFFLLYATYGNNPIINMDVFQWKMKVFKIIFIHGPIWQRKQQIQKDLRNLAEEDLLAGSKQIYNHAFNDSSAPSTDTLDELTYINDQNVARNKKSYMEAYSILWQNLHSSETEEYIIKFRPCFSQFLRKHFTIDFIEED